MSLSGFFISFGLRRREIPKCSSARENASSLLLMKFLAESCLKSGLHLVKGHHHVGKETCTHEIPHIQTHAHKMHTHTPCKEANQGFLAGRGRRANDDHARYINDPGHIAS